MKSKIAIVTGSRAEFGVLTPIIKAIQSSKKLELQLIVTGTHLLKNYGCTITEIKKHFKIKAVIPIYRENSTLADTASSIGLAIIKFTKAFSDLKPDVVFVTGDRTEQLAAAVASAYLNIPIAHYVGGERSKGTIDESARHAISKLANIHFVKTNQSRQRLIKLGENKRNIFIVGFSALDTILNAKLIPKRKEAKLLAHRRLDLLANIIAKKLNLNLREKILIVLQHPISTQVPQAKYQMEQTMKAVTNLKLQTVIIYPNSDPGSEEIIKVIEKHRNLPYIRIIKSMPYNEYLSLLKISSALIGNSSGFTAESLPFKLPVINIGIRQTGRERTQNFIDVPHNAKAITKAIKKALYDKNLKKRIKNMKNPFGKGKTSQKIAKILENIKIDKSLLQKQITY